MQAKPSIETKVSNVDLSPLTIGNRIVWKPAGPNKGRGVFALTDFAEGEIIETSPVTVVSKSETDLFDDEDKTGVVSIIDQYLFWWSETPGQEYCMGHGFLMMYNHAPEPNAMLRLEYDIKAISMIAARDIKAGEEITFDYDFDEEDGPWFEIVS